MKINMFEEFLRDRHADEYRGTKDDMVDDFEEWVCRLDPDQWLNYGEWYGNKCAKQQIEKHIKSLEQENQ